MEVFTYFKKDHKKNNQNLHGQSKESVISKVSLRPEFSTNLTFKNPLKNPTSYLVDAGF